jgi:hypothetical protein
MRASKKISFAIFLHFVILNSFQDLFLTGFKAFFEILTT